MSYPHVTSIIEVVSKPFLYKWYADHGWEYCEVKKDVSKAFGTQLHADIEQYLKGTELSITVDSPLDHIIRWIMETGFKATAQEIKVKSKKYKYCGRFDAIGKFGDDETLYIIDWKTSAGINKLEYALQLAAYSIAYEEEHSIVINQGLIVRINKKNDGKKKIEVYEVKDLTKYKKMFLDLRDIYDEWKEQNWFKVNNQDL